MIKHLNPREKTVIIAGLMVLIFLFVWFALLTPYLKTMQTLDRKISAHRRSLQKVDTMREQISQLRRQLADVEIRVEGGKYSDRVQELHIKIIHILIELIESKVL
jgi:type II secretory pathway component PulM